MKNWSLTLRKSAIGMLVILCSQSTTALGRPIFGYNLGLTYGTTASYAAISYEAPEQADLPTDCESNASNSDLMRCTAYLAPDGEGQYSVAAYLEKPFKRQGMFYFDAGFTFATLSYKGTLGDKPENRVSTLNKDNSKSGTSLAVPSDTSGSQPLTHALMELYGLDLQSYIRAGFTPRYVPDVMLTLGFGLQMVAGRLKIFTEDKKTFVYQPGGFAELEVVLVRLGTGALSVFLGHDQSIPIPVGSNLVDDNPSGTSLTNFRLGLVAAGSGVRLLIPM